MPSKRAPKKVSSKIPPETAERIVAIALQNPELGARRLVPQLKKKRIAVSATSIQNILRSHGLQTRAKRLAKLEARPKKTRKPKLPSKKKPAAKITDAVADRICEIALQNPELGARRLLPLLQKQKISASSSAVYRILKRRGLQTRQKRLDKAAETAAKPIIFPKKFPGGIPSGVEERIVELSLQNPDLGARRLMRLLQQEDVFVSASAVYSILKRNGMENRPKRLLKLEDQQAPAAAPAPEIEGPGLLAEPVEIEPTPAADELPEPFFEPAIAVSFPPAAEAPMAEKEPEPLPEPAIVAPAEAERPPLRKTPLKPTRKRSHWVFYALYLLLFILIGYLGFQAVRAIQVARLETQAVAAVSPAGVRPETQPEISRRPLNDYRVIWQRDLFSITAAGDSDVQKKIALEKIALAPKNLGLELVGTVVADDPKMSLAIIDNSKTREQEAYREGDEAGKVKIKKILRNNVVITTAEGDGLLTVEIKESAKSATAATPTINIGSSSPVGQQAPRSTRLSARSRSITLKREEVEASLSDIDALLEKVRLTPYMQGDQPSGFRISNIPADSVLRQMGLRSRDVIVGVDDENITSPDQASDFFQRLATGDAVTIRVKRRRRTRQINLSIE